MVWTDITRPEYRRDGLRIHVAALATQAEVFWVTEARFRAACARHPETVRRLDVDWSWDLDRFEEGVRDAEIMIGWRFSYRKTI